MSTAAGRVLSAVLASVLFLSAVLLLTAAPAEAAATVTIDAGQRYQTIGGLGVNANARSWDNGRLAPALDQLTDQLGATAFRVVVENGDWEATNDDADPAHFNQAYYDQVYSSPEFTDLWSTIAYLNAKKVTVSLDVMGPLAAWMGGSSLATGQEAEWVEMMASLLYYARVVKGLDLTLFEPFNEPDWNGIEGTKATADQVVRVSHQLLVRLDSLGLGDVKLVLPDTASTSAGVGSYFSAMQGDSFLMGRVVVLGLHSYSGDTGNAASVIGASAYPSLPFWMNEFSAVCSGCDNGAPNPDDWPFARTTAQYLMNSLRQGASGAEVWEGYDSYYEHHGSWSYWGLLGYDTATGTYHPRRSFDAMAQFMRFIRPGAVRVVASSSSSNVSVLSFHDPATGRLTLVGLNTSSGEETVSGDVAGVDGLSTLGYYRTNADSALQSVGDVTVTGGHFTVSVPADTLFTLSGVAGPDTTPPAVTLTAPADGATVAGATQLAATATDDRGVARVELAVDGLAVGTLTQPPYQLTWDARTVTPGPHTVTAHAVDAAGNGATATAQVTVVTDTSPPSAPTGLVGVAPTTAQVSLGWQASTDDVAVAGYRVLRDGVVLGDTTATSYADTTVSAGHSYEYTVRARDTSDNLSPPSSPVTVTVGSVGTVTVDVQVTTHQTSAASTISSPTFSTTQPGDQLVAFASSDGPPSSAQSFSSVTGGGLTWRLRQRVNAQAGTSEIWTATAPTVLSGARVTATRSSGSWLGSLTVVAFSGADTTRDGATAGASAATGAPLVRLTTTRAGSRVWAAGNDWDRAVARTVPTGQTLVDQFLASVGDTFWVQLVDSPTASAGDVVTVNDTAPTNDRWNFAAIEVVPAGVAPPDTTAPSTQVTAPSPGIVSGVTTVTASASDDVGVTRVELYVDGALVATDASAPYSFAWDTTAVPNGEHQLGVKAYDAAGNVGTSAAVAVTVANETPPPPDTTAPTAQVTAPSPGTVSGVTTVTASASDDVGVTRVELYVDGSLVATDASAPYSFAWDTSSVADGERRLSVKAYDAAGNVGTSAAVAVTVANETPPPPDTTAPTAQVTAPSPGTVSGVTTVTASASDDVGVTRVELYVDGSLVATDASAPYSFAWDTSSVADGAHQLSVKAYDAAGNVGTSAAVAVTVANAVVLAVDVQVTTHQSSAASRISSPTFGTSRPGDLLVAFASSDGPARNSQTFRSVTGAGLTWRMRQRANTQAGTAEVWTAVAPGALSGARVTATRSRGSYVGSLTVVAFSGADTVTDGAVARASGATGAPSVTLTATRAGSWVWAVGTDWDRAVARTVPAGQTLVDEFLATGVGDTFWVQRVDDPVPAAGATVTVRDSAPTNDRWNLVAIEVRPR